MNNLIIDHPIGQIHYRSWRRREELIYSLFCRLGGSFFRRLFQPSQARSRLPPRSPNFPLQAHALPRHRRRSHGWNLVEKYPARGEDRRSRHALPSLKPSSGQRKWPTAVFSSPRDSLQYRLQDLTKPRLRPSCLSPENTAQGTACWGSFQHHLVQTARTRLF